MKFVVSKKDKAGNLQYVRHVESAQKLPETLTSCEKSGVCPLPGWVRVASDAYKFETSEAALACLDTLPKNTIYTIAEYNGYVRNL